MKRLMVMFVMMLVSMPVLARADHPWDCGGGWRYGYRQYGYRQYGSRQHPWDYGRGYGYVYRGGGWYNNGGYYGGYGYPTNVKINYRERWDVQGGERIYEQSPDYLGKIIDTAASLGAIAILSH